MGDVVFPLGEHEVGAVVANDAHVFDPGAGEDRVVGVAGPVNAVARSGMAQRHGRRPVAGVAGVPEMIGSIVVDQDVASFADFAVPGVAPGAGEDRVFRDRRPGGQRPGRRSLLCDRPGRGSPPEADARNHDERDRSPSRVQEYRASLNHLRIPRDCDGQPVCRGRDRNRL